MRVRILTFACLASAAVSSCTPSGATVAPLTDAERAEIAESVRDRIDDFIAMRLQRETLCQDPTPIREFFAYPGGVSLDVQDSTLRLWTEEEFNAEGIPADYWCGIEDETFEIDSVVVHVLTRDVARTAFTSTFSISFASDPAVTAKTMDVWTWQRMDGAWRMVGAVSHQFATPPDK